MRLFAIHNRAYKLRYVIADDIETALTLAVQAGHIKRAQGYRKWLDCTDTASPALKKLLRESRAGVLVESETGWHLSS